MTVTMARTFIFKNIYSHQSSISIAFTYLVFAIFIAVYNQKAIAEERNIKRDCLVIKVAVFVDMSLKIHFRKNLRLEDSQVNILLRSYIKQVEAIFSRLRSESIYKIHLEFVDASSEKFTSEFSNKIASAGANLDQLLDKFCQYQHELRPRTWDLSLLLTAQDLYSEEEAELFGSHKLSSTTMGISILNGLEWHDLSCLIVEFGVDYNSRNLEDSVENRVYPTRGFGSAWVAAHEIAHSLGIHHDGPPFNEDCFKSGYLMSSSNYIKSMPTEWSNCSSRSLDSMDHLGPFLTEHNHKGCLLTTDETKNLPGQLFDAQFQCRVFSELLIQAKRETGNICSGSMLCLTESGKSVAIGPALEGTQCRSDGSICIEGSCTSLKDIIANA